MTFDVSKRSVLVEETADRIVASEQLINVRRRIGYKRRKLEVADEVGAIKRGPSHPPMWEGGRPRKTWSACVRNNMTICNLDGVNPLDRNSWRTSVRRCQVLPTPESGTTAAP